MYKHHKHNQESELHPLECVLSNMSIASLPTRVTILFPKEPKGYTR